MAALWVAAKRKEDICRMEDEEWRSLKPISRLPSARLPERQPTVKQESREPKREDRVVNDLCYPKDEDLFPTVARTVAAAKAKATSEEEEAKITSKQSACGAQSARVARLPWYMQDPCKSPEQPMTSKHGVRGALAWCMTNGGSSGKVDVKRAASPASPDAPRVRTASGRRRPHPVSGQHDALHGLGPEIVAIYTPPPPPPKSEASRSWHSAEVGSEMRPRRSADSSSGPSKELSLMDSLATEDSISSVDKHAVLPFAHHSGRPRTSRELDATPSEAERFGRHAPQSSNQACVDMNLVGERLSIPKPTRLLSSP